MASALTLNVTVSMPVGDANAAGVNSSSSSGASTESTVAELLSASSTILAVPLDGTAVHEPAPRVMPAVPPWAIGVSAVSAVKLASNQSLVVSVLPSKPAATAAKAPQNESTATEYFVADARVERMDFINMPRISVSL